MAGGTRFCFSGCLANLSSLRCGMWLRHTESLKGPQNKNWYCFIW
ncbi:hypothetical protein [Adhaeribacter radiodurans]|nr:hypothetical protein [Adhaeribacter radiodurans]